MPPFQQLEIKAFLTQYWQKKPVIIRQALAGFNNPLTADELAGLAMEEEIESRLVLETPEKEPRWHLQRGPFLEKDFENLPATHWTLLVQAVDRFIPEVASLLDHFDFIPQWRIDDVMISYAADQGSVGPHYDNYDVFLYQAKGSRKWLLTTKNCHQANYLPDLDLRIMSDFQVEEEYILEEGDMLYLPAHVGHYGMAHNGACMTYSFGYRSYQAQELWESFAEFLSEKEQAAAVLYQDPSWADISETSELPQQSWLNAKKLMQASLDNEHYLKDWFGCFATRLDQQAEELLPLPLMMEECPTLEAFIHELLNGGGLIRHPVCRFAYQEVSGFSLFINGCQWELENTEIEFAKLLANKRSLRLEEVQPFIAKNENQLFLFELWKLQWIEIVGPVDLSLD